MLTRRCFLVLTTVYLLFACPVDGLRTPSLPFNLGNLGAKQNARTPSAITEFQLPTLPDAHGNLGTTSARNTKLAAASATVNPDTTKSKFPPVPTQKECLAFVIPALGIFELSSTCV
mgnify:CR=1 FL=1